MADLNFSYIELQARRFLMRGILPAVFLPVELMRYLPGDPRGGWKYAVIWVCGNVSKPLFRLNSWMYRRELAMRGEVL